MTMTWEELGARSAARQFGDHGSSYDVDAVVAALDATGPVQSQTARAPYVGLGARLPGVERDTISAAHEQWRVVRGSNLRGTVHTSTAADHALLEAVTRLALRTTYERTWRLAGRSSIFAGDSLMWLPTCWMSCSPTARARMRRAATRSRFSTGSGSLP